MTVNSGTRENRFRRCRAMIVQSGSFHIGTFSKLVAPAIRVSYLVLPKSLLALYRERGRVISSTVSRVDQRIIAGFLDGGYYERHLNKMRAVYKARHDVLLEELKAFRRICRVSGEQRGYIFC